MMGTHWAFPQKEVLLTSTFLKRNMLIHCCFSSVFAVIGVVSPRHKTEIFQAIQAVEGDDAKECSKDWSCNGGQTFELA